MPSDVRSQGRLVCTCPTGHPCLAATAACLVLRGAHCTCSTAATTKAIYRPSRIATRECHRQIAQKWGKGNGRCRHMRCTSRCGASVQCLAKRDRGGARPSSLGPARERCTFPLMARMLWSPLRVRKQQQQAGRGEGGRAAYRQQQRAGKLEDDWAFRQTCAAHGRVLEAECRYRCSQVVD